MHENNRKAVQETIEDYLEEDNQELAKEAQLFFSALQDIATNNKCGSINFSQQMATYTHSSGKRLYLFKYTMYDGSGNSLSKRESIKKVDSSQITDAEKKQAYNEIYLKYQYDQPYSLMENPDMGILVLSTSKETDRGALRAVSLLESIGVLNVNVSLVGQKFKKPEGLQLGAKIELLEEQVTELNKQVKDAKKRGINAQGRVGQLKNDIYNLEDDLKEKLKILENTKTELDEKTEKLDNTKKELDKTSTDYNATVKRNKNLESAMKKALQELADPGFRKKKAIEGAKKELNDSLNSLF